LSSGAIGTAADSDEALLAAIQKRDQRAIAALYDRYGGLAVGLAYSILGERSVAEDVVQDAFMGVWRRAVSFEAGRGSVRTWLLSIVHHRAIDRLRGVSGRARLDAPIDDFERVLAVDDPWGEVEVRVQREVLQNGLATLPEEQRRTIEMAYFNGYTQQEIAAAMNVPVGTVKGRLRIGLQKMRSLLAGSGVEQS
jgi:RNA polymerase sigma-70 factor (ECF subfamily)